MNRLLQLLLILAMALPGLAQKPKWGRPIQAEKKSYTPTIVGDDDKSIYTVEVPNSKEIMFERFDKKKLGRDYTKTVEIPRLGRKKYDLERISFIGGKFLVFASVYNSGSHEYELRAFTYDGKNARSAGDFEIFNNKVEKKRRKGDFEVFTSNNKERFLIYYTTYYKEKDQTIEVVKLYNQNVELVTEKEYIYDGEHEGSIGNILLDDEGSVYYLQGEDVVILDANQGYEEWRESIVLEEQGLNGGISRIYLAINGEGDLMVIGDYLTTDLSKTDENKSRRERKKNDTQIEGVFFMKINGFTKETEVAKLSKFDKEFLDQFRSEKDVRKGRDAEMNNTFDSFEFFFKEDGGLVFVMEDRMIIRRYSNGRLVGESYLYNDLVSYNFSPEGDLVWATRIPKKQTYYWNSMLLGFMSTSVGMTWFAEPYYAKGHFSYLAGLSDDKFYIIYNDHEKNAREQSENSKQREIAKVRYSVPVMYTIDLETGVKKKSLELGFNSGKLHLKPIVNFQRSQEYPLYVFCMNRKTFSFGRVDFNDLTRKSAKR